MIYNYVGGTKRVRVRRCSERMVVPFFTLFWNKKTLRALNYFLLVPYDFQCSCFLSKLKTFGYSSPSCRRVPHGFSLRNRGIRTTINVSFGEYFPRFAILCFAEVFGICYTNQLSLRGKLPHDISSEFMVSIDSWLTNIYNFRKSECDTRVVTRWKIRAREGDNSQNL